MRPPPAISIEIADEQRCLPLDRVRLRRAIRSVLRAESIRKARISLAVVDDPTMARLNAQYLDHQGPTDVLSFVLEQADDWLEGEVIVGAETAIRAAPRYGLAAADELLLYVIHGALHLVGYDDTTPAARAKMRRREREVMEWLGTRLPTGTGHFSAQ